MKLMLRIYSYVFIGHITILLIVTAWYAETYAGPIIVDESAIRAPGQYTGPLPRMITAFAKALPVNTWDILPLGPDRNNALYLFSLFDTGSTSVAISAQGKELLGLEVLPATVDVRINGIGAIDADTLDAPIGPPVYKPPQSIVANVPVGTSSRGVTLIGAPVANSVIAYMDNRENFWECRGPYPFLEDNLSTPDVDETMVTGPDIRFYSRYGFPGLASIEKSEAVVLKLARFGSVGMTNEGAIEGQRYYLRNVAFSDGGHHLSDQGGSTLNVFWDSGTNFTAVSQIMAQTLGLLDRERDFTCKMRDGSQLPGYEIDSVVMTGRHDGHYGKTYTIKNARVCVDNNDVPFGGIADARIGSNFFDQVPILFNGPQNTLTILRDIIKGDLNEDGSVDCLDEAMLLSEIRRPSQQVSLDGYTLVGFSGDVGNTLQVQYTADEIVKIKSVHFDFTTTNVVYDMNGETTGDETQIFDFPEDSGTIENIVWLLDLDQLSAGTGTPLRSDYMGGRVTVEIVDGTLIETFFNAPDSEALAQDLFGAAARFSIEIPNFQLSADPRFDINKDGKVDKLDLISLNELFDNPDNVPCDPGQVRPGDVDGDGQVATEEDVVAFREAFGTVNGDDDFNAFADLDGNDSVNVDDLKIFRKILEDI